VSAPSRASSKSPIRSHPKNPFAQPSSPQFPFAGFCMIEPRTGNRLDDADRVDHSCARVLKLEQLAELNSGIRY